MPLHADEHGWKLIRYFKRRFLKQVTDRVHNHFEDIIQEREQDGWERRSTPEIAQVFDDVLGNFHPEVDSSDRKFNRDADRLYKLMQVFLVIYDSDDAYAAIFHKFVDRCNRGDLDLDPDDLQLRTPRGEREDYEEELNKQEIPNNEVDLDSERFDLPNFL